MTFKEFKAWCNERACDGCWSYFTAIFCMDIVKEVNRKPFWRREKFWQVFNFEYEIEGTIVKPINEKIEALMKGE
jgi:hypothetical protein